MPQSQNKDIMKTKLYSLTMCFLLLHIALFAQKENNVWVFGKDFGLDFNAGTPKQIKTAIVTSEGCASICNPAGRLLFYTNGSKVWDSTYTVMPNGTGLPDSFMSCTMSSVIVPVTTDSNQYLLFSLSPIESRNNGWQTGLYTSLIDMRLNGGKGDIVAGQKGIRLTPDTLFSEKIIVIPSCRGTWVLTHHADSPIFYAYHVSGRTISKPVRSVVPGLIYKNIYALGEMKISPDNKRLAVGSHYIDPFGGAPTNQLEIMDFDAKTGVVSGAQVIDVVRLGYSVEFSADGTKLYSQNSRDIFQYDLSLLPSVTAVRASKYDVSGILAGLSRGYRTMRRGPDNKIYCVGIYSEIGRIEDPNKAGAACSFTPVVAALPLTPTYSFSNFGNSAVKPGVSSAKPITTAKDITVCQGKTITVPKPTGADYAWNDGSTSLTRTFTTSGTYLLTSYSDCDTYVDTFRITIQPKKLMTKTIDTAMCFDQALTIQAGAGDLYLWSDGSTGRSNSISAAGSHWVAVDDTTACVTNIDTYNVSVIDFNLTLRDTVLCNGSKIKLDAGIGQPAKYVWQNGFAGQTLLVDKPGNYWVEVSVGSCKKRGNIQVAEGVKASLGEDRMICSNTELTLQLPVINGAVYRWNTGDTTPYLVVRKEGIYSMTIAKDGCTVQDTVKITTEKCDRCIDIPNAFTPNGDGKNDLFKPIVSCRVASYSFKIFNRYGEEIFNTTDYLRGWDGNIKGQEAELGVYFYLIKASFAGSLSETLLKGDVSMLR